jgi:hypothetical protein
VQIDNSEELNLLNENQGNIRRDNGIFLGIAFFFYVVGLDILPGLHTYIEHLAIPVWAYASFCILCLLGVIHGSVTLEKNKKLISEHYEFLRQREYLEESLGSDGDQRSSLD